MQVLQLRDHGSKPQIHFRLDPGKESPNDQISHFHGSSSNSLGIRGFLGPNTEISTPYCISYFGT